MRWVPHPLQSLLATVALIANLSACDVMGDQKTSDIRRPGQFRVTDEVVNKDLTPFTATIPGIGNTLIGENGGFEPFIYRNKYSALANSPDRVIVAPDALSNYDTLREGFLDGAEVRVYRIESGKFQVVREDSVAAAGFHVSGWLSVLPAQQVISPTSSSFTFRWDGWNRSGVKYYFTVRAVDRAGKLSAPAPAFEIERPLNAGAGGNASSSLEFFPKAFSAGSVPAPRNLRGRVRPDGSLLLEWDTAGFSDLAGYVVYRSDYPPEQHAGYYLQLAKKAESARENIRAGDMVVVSKKFRSTSRNRHLSNRAWGAESEFAMLLPGTLAFFPDEHSGKTWELVPHAKGTPVDNPGETFLKLTLPSGAGETVGIYNHSGVRQNWYPVLEKRTYRVEVWIRQEGSGTVRFKFDGFYNKSPNVIPPIVFHAGPQWKKYTATFTPRAVQEGSDPGRMGLEFFGPGTFSVDNFRVYRADADYLDLLPGEYAELKASGMSALRTHGLIKTKFRTYDMQQLTNDFGAISGTAKSNSLPQLLRLIRRVGARPWLQTEFHMSSQEWRGFVEYMAAPYDPAVDTPAAKPWAYKRHIQGQTKPWTDEFDQILFELGNETWNGLFYPWNFGELTDGATGKTYSGGQSYGLFQEQVVSVMRSSPYWLSAGLEKKFVFVLGGWGGQSYGRDAASVSPNSSYLTIGAYNGGWDEGEGPPKLDAASLFNVLSQVNQSAIPVADRHASEVGGLEKNRRTRLRLGTYEAGPGYALNGLNGAQVTEEQSLEQELVMKSVAAGVASIDSFLARAYRGFDLQNYFLFGGGVLWSSHSPWYRGGQAYPVWQLLSLFNSKAAGDLLRVVTTSVPTADLKPFERRKGMASAPLAAVYATRAGNRYAVLALSRKIPQYPVSGDDGYTPLKIELPFTEARTVTLYRVSGEPMANALISGDTSIEKMELTGLPAGRVFSIDAASGADERGLPPASAFLYVFDGVAGGKTH